MKSIWVECPGKLVGWYGIVVLGNQGIVIRYPDNEIPRQLRTARETYPDASLIEARDAPEEINWNEECWRRMFSDTSQP